MPSNLLVSELLASCTSVQVYRRCMTDMTEIQLHASCRLPLGGRPLRVHEFDDLFTQGLTGQQRLSPTVLRWTLDRRVGLAARDLMARETACCSFFRFDFAVD